MDTNDERREKNFRLPIKLLVKFTSDHFKGNFFIQNLSSGGLYIETERPPAVGTELDIVIVFPHSQNKLKYRGKVCWNKTATNSNENLGMGVEFIGTSEQDREKLESTLLKYKAIME